jgi:type VI protein secretion system component VasK
MSNEIGLLSLGVALVALFMTFVLWSYQRKSAANERQAMSAEATAQTGSVHDALEEIDVDTTNLNNDEKLSLAKRLIHNHTQWLRIDAGVSAVLSLAAMGMAVYSFSE